VLADYVLGWAPFFLNPRSLLKHGAVFVVILTLFVISTNGTTRRPLEPSTDRFLDRESGKTMAGVWAFEKGIQAAARRVALGIGD
jgi:hypothetical protein